MRPFSAITHNEWPAMYDTVNRYGKLGDVTECINNRILAIRKNTTIMYVCDSENRNAGTACKHENNCEVNNVSSF